MPKIVESIASILHHSSDASPTSLLSLMPREQLELPPQVAKAFVKDMRAYFKANDQNKRDEIAARQRSALSEFQGPHDKKLRLTDVIKMFHEMRDSA